MNHQKNGDESAPMSDPNGGGNAVAGKKCPSCLAGFSREDIAGNCTCDIEPRTTSPLEQIQKERREAFQLQWGIAPLGSLKWRKGTDIEYFLSESIRIAYEAGMEVYYRPAETISLSKYERARQEGYEAGQQDKSREIFFKIPLSIRDAEEKGFRAGLERARELVPKELIRSREEFESDSAYKNMSSLYNWYNKCRYIILSALDDEIKKNDR